jgi:hypothetical protein
MKREELGEFHHLTAFAHVPSILQVGILSHDRAAGRQQVDISNPGIQDHRRLVTVPGGRRLHEYACLYIHARNAMLFSMKERQDLAVVAVDVGVLDIPGVVVSDRNAGAYMPLFQDPAAGIEALDAAVVRARYWNEQTKQRRQAEVLVPDAIPPNHLLHIYVRTAATADNLRALTVETECNVLINADLFFGAG